MTKLEAAFTDALLKQLLEAEAITGVAETRLMERAGKLGGPRAVSELLSRGQTTRQFDALRRKNRLDLSPESLVIKGKYAPLFTDEEANLCLETLLNAGAFG